MTAAVVRHRRRTAVDAVLDVLLVVVLATAAYLAAQALKAAVTDAAGPVPAYLAGAAAVLLAALLPFGSRT